MAVLTQSRRYEYIELYSKRDVWLTERDPHFDQRLRLDIGYLELKHVEPLCFKYLGFGIY